MRILLAQINPTIGDLPGNGQKIVAALERAREWKAQLVLFSELALCGYPPEDFLLMPHFCQAVEDQLAWVTRETQGMTAIVGTIRRNPGGEKGLCNSAAVLSDGELLGFQDKLLLPTYDVFTERRYFDSGQALQLWPLANQRVAITICEDLWQHSRAVTETAYTRDPIGELKPLKPDLLLNLSASPYSVGRVGLRTELGRSAAQTLGCPVLLCNQVGGNDSLIFDGSSYCVDQSGRLLARAASFVEELLLVDTEAPPQGVFEDLKGPEELYRALVLGLRDYFVKSGFSRACLGLSGGIDSAVVAGIAVEALGSSNVLAVVMPSRFSGADSMSDARRLALGLKMGLKEISIEKPFETYLELLAPHFTHYPPDVTEENLQARVRGMLLMALSNKLGYVVLSTGNKSELAMGYATLYGDMCGGLGVISDVTKGQVYALAQWINRHHEVIPAATLSRPPSAELRPNQRDTDSLPDYSIVDAVLQDYVESHLSPDEIAQRHNLALSLVQELIQRIHRNEYKRRQSPPGLRVTQRAFTAGRRFPIVQRFV